MPLKKRFALPQWVPTTVQSGGRETYKQGTPPYQEGGWSPLWALAGQGATSVGKDVMCRAAKRFRTSFCRRGDDDDDDAAAPPSKKKRKSEKKHQRGSGPPIYQAGTDPYQEGGLLPLLGLLFKGMTGGGGAGLLFKGVGVSRRRGRFNLRGGSKTKKKKEEKEQVHHWVVGPHSRLVSPDWWSPHRRVTR